jgi:hypothetical protein
MINHKLQCATLRDATVVSMLAGIGALCIPLVDVYLLNLAHPSLDPTCNKYSDLIGLNWSIHILHLDIIIELQVLEGGLFVGS